MEVEQPTTDVDSDVESRLTAHFAAEAPEAAPKEADAKVDAEAPEAEEESAPEPEEADLVDIELDDGEVYRGPAKLREAVERHKDYTQKTQELSALRKSVDDKAYFVEARETITAAVQEDIAEFKALEFQRKQFESLDWQALYNADPGQAMRLRDQRDDLQRQLQAKAGQIQQKSAQGQQILSAHTERQWQLAVEGAKQRIGKLTAEEDQAMHRQAQALGFTPEEFKSRLSDARILHAIHKAAKWDALQSGKPAAVQAAQKAPPVIKPGASAGPGAVAQAKYKDLRQSLKKSGSLKDAARLFALKG